MISKVSSNVAGTAYAGLATQNKDIKQNARVVTQQESGQSRVERLKAQVDAGEYKVDLSALAQKMADELL